MTRWTAKETSDFNLFNRFLLGDDITPVLEQRSGLGFNSCRVWCAYDLLPGIGRLNPSEHPAYFQRWPEFMELLASYGLYAEVTAFTGPYPFFPSQASMIQFWDDLCHAVEDCSNLLDLEAINEYDNGPNLGVPLNALRQPPGCLSSHGSGAQDSSPYSPHWNVAGWRSPFSEWQRKVGHGPMEWADEWGIPVWTNEYPRTDNDPNPDHWFDGAAGGALLCAGAGCFHSPSGKNSTLFTGSELVCASSFIAGANSVPLEFQAGVYSRVEPNPPGILRIYRRTLSDGRFHEVQIRA